MIINTNFCLAFKCYKCDHVQLFDISIFKMLQKENSILKCQCKGTYIRLIKINDDKFKLAIYCKKCDVTHIFLLSKRAVFSKNVFVIYCPYSKCELCVIGKNRDLVLEEVDRIERKIEHYVNKKCNKKDYFTNSKVVFESLDKISSIIKQGKVICKCGSTDISIYLLKDRLLLRCNNCMAKKEIKAASNKDLVNLLNKKGIFLEK